MPFDRKHLAERLHRDLEDMPLLRRNAADPTRDREGSCASVLGDALHDVGMMQFLLHRDVHSFRQGVRESALIQLHLFERFRAGEPIDPSYCSMVAYKDLFDALAAQDFEIARSLATHMGGREEIEEQFDHPFTIAMGYSLKWFVLDDPASSHEWLAKLRILCADKRVEDVRSEDFMGYAEVLSALLGQDLSAADKGFNALVHGHQRQSKEDGMYANLLDRYLCVWGVGMANLCRWRGLKVAGVPPLIPSELLL